MNRTSISDGELNHWINKWSDKYYRYSGSNSVIENALRDLKVERAKVAMLNDVREQMADGIAHLNGLLDWAYDGLDEHWAALPENVERMKTLAGLFGRKHK